MDGLTAKDKNLIALTQKVDGLSKRFEALFAQSDELAKKQFALETLHTQLAEVDELAKKTTWQMDSLKQSRQDLELLRKDVQDFYEAHAEVAQLRDKLGTDRLALEAFSERMTALGTRAPRARSEDGRHPRQDDARRRGHAEGDTSQ